ncbi:molybdenum cofactor biosysynthesis protein [Cryobacterium roopkundense]|uniref:MOSC domain-containing protein YiiM n=1 Tax=Cryobacterium roopkundense TaxID=1001240 RepID=A0A099JL78_9MICO|nr:MOSC domain-containing protein [Cryobacterium roopkundense]KGJ78382.1 molybdenum cofactor biosysynthesis protein [Cryobacterium roopkundense]MBB5639975.1 MOSC domain-containing protein YiiM [Cryobacterium roopkundense]
MPQEQPAVVSVSRDDRHRFSKPTVSEIRLLTGYGVEGDTHAGATTQHRFLAKKDPTRPNLTQVHLIQAELFDDLDGFTVTPGELGENVTTRGVDLMSLPLGARLHLGADAVVEITGMRSPCSSINGYQPGLMKALITTDAAGRPVRRAGVMAVVAANGTIRAGDAVRVELPSGEQLPLGVV